MDSLSATQIAINSGKIIYWEIIVATNVASVIKRPVRITTKADTDDGPYHFCYALDGSLYITNATGSVWNASSLNNLRNIYF